MPSRLIQCGDVPIHWLPRDTAVGDNELRAHVHHEEWSKASTFKSERRRAEFLRSRYLTRKLTACTLPLPADSSGNPSWPEDWVGSITHKDGHVGVALLPKSNWLSVGIDAEDPGRMREEFAAKIAGPGELTYLQTLASTQGWSLPLVMTILFSFKEAVFKAHYPLGRKPFYFHDASIEQIVVADATATTKSGTMSAVVHVDTSPLTPAGTVVQGCFREFQTDDRSFILTSVAIPRPG